MSSAPPSVVLPSVPPTPHRASRRRSAGSLGLAGAAVAVALGATAIAGPASAYTIAQGPLQVTLDTRVYTVAGDGNARAVPYQDDLPATQAQIEHPSTVVYDHHGNLYTADSSCRIRRVDTHGTISTPAQLHGGENDDCGVILAVDVSDTVYTTNATNTAIYRVNADGSRTRVAGGGSSTAASGPALDKAMSTIAGMTFGTGGTLYVSDWGANHVYAVNGSQLTTVGGNGTNTYNGDGIPATDAAISNPRGIAVAPDGSVVVGESCRIRSFQPGGTISTIAGLGYGNCGLDGDGGPATAARVLAPSAITFANGTMYFAEQFGEVVRSISSTGIMHTLAGHGFGFNGDGLPPLQTDFETPMGVAVSPTTGFVAIADRDNNRIRVVRPKLPFPLTTP